jgi:hypothetical protein
MNTLQMAKQVLTHPLDFFYDLQYYNQAKWRQGFIMILFVFVARIVSLYTLGFAYETRESYQISIMLEGLWIVVPWITWVVANWAISTIKEGEGKFKEIFVGTAFAFTPYILLAVPIALITNLLNLDEKTIYITLSWFMYIWMVYLVLVKIKILHDFENGKMVWISLLTLIGVFIIWFIGLLLMGLLTQAVNFVLSIIKEISFRM